MQIVVDHQGWSVIAGSQADDGKQCETSVRRGFTELNAEPLLEFIALFDLKEGIPKLVVCFLAILELAREGLVRITQQDAFTPIYVQAGDVLG